jgi:hypothetical protein
MTKATDELAELKKKVEELEAKVSPQSTFVPESDEQFRDRMHQLAEKRMSLATPPSVRQYFADGVTPADCADILKASHAPQGPSTQGPSSQPSPDVRRGNVPGGGTGWIDPTPLSNPPGTNWVDAIAIADDVRQRKGKP